MVDESLVTKALLELRDDARLDRSLTDLARLRPQVGNTLADAAIEASYRIYLQPGIEARAARTSRTVESWLASAETHVTTPPVDVLLEVAASPREVFDRVGHWISGDDSLRSEIALAVHTQRRYAPRVPSGFRTLAVASRHIYGVEYSGKGPRTFVAKENMDGENASDINAMVLCMIKGESSRKTSETKMERKKIPAVQMEQDDQTANQE